jgi:hypothetical protein
MKVNYVCKIKASPLNRKERSEHVLVSLDDFIEFDVIEFYSLMSKSIKEKSSLCLKSSFNDLIIYTSCKVA